MCVKIAKKVKKYLDSKMLTGVNPLDEPGMEIILQEEDHPKEITPSHSPPKPKKAKKPLAKESIIDLQHLKDTENPEKLEYDYDTFE